MPEKLAVPVARPVAPKDASACHVTAFFAVLLDVPPALALALCVTAFVVNAVALAPAVPFAWSVNAGLDDKSASRSDTA
jgi:hypothetical protein